LSLIFGMLGIINFAHGSLYMLGAYLVWSFIRLLNFQGSFWLSLLITFPLMGIFGLIIERVFLRRMYREPAVYQILITFGLLLVIQQSVALIYGTMPLSMNVSSLFAGEINLGVLRYPSYRFFTIILGLTLIFGIWIFIERSSLGAIIRASAEDSETTKTLGINTNRVYAWTFCLGSALAGLAGGLHVPLVGGLQVYIGSEILLVCFIVVVIGGMGSIPGALIGGIILGVVRSLSSIFWPPISEFVMYVTMGIILLVRPQGLLGKGIK